MSMKIDYKKFNEYSENSQLKIIKFARFLLGIIEIYNEDEIPLSDFKKDGFSFEEATSLVKKLNEILDDIITEFYSDTSPAEDRTYKTFVFLKCKSDTIIVINSFLNEVSKNKIDYKKSIRSKAITKALKKKIAESNPNWEDLVNFKNETTNTYIIKGGEDFKYKGAILTEIAKDTDYYIVFNALYNLLPEGGFVDYKKLGNEVIKYIPKTKRLKKDKLIRFIQRNLTDEHNGFLHYAGIKNSTAGGKKLIRAIRGKGIDFNNSKGD